MLGAAFPLVYGFLHDIELVLYFGPLLLLALGVRSVISAIFHESFSNIHGNIPILSNLILHILLELIPIHLSIPKFLLNTIKPLRKFLIQYIHIHT